METAIPLETLAKTPNKNKTPVGSGVAPEEMQTPVIRTGTVKEIAHSPHIHDFLPETTTLWTHR